MIIDAHTHTFPEKVAPKALAGLARASGLTPVTNGTLPDTLQKMAECGIDRFVVLNIATAPAQQQTINTVAAENSAQYPAVTALGSVHPGNPHAVEELARIKALGLRGIKLHPDYQGVMIDDPSLFPIYDACAQLELPIVFHAGWDCYSPNLVHAPPARSAAVAKAFPRLKMVLAHLGGLRMWEEVTQYLTGLENVYFDTAMAATLMDSPEQAMAIIRRHPIERILLGSDCPWEDPAHSVEFVRRLPLSQNAIESILGKNAQELFQIT